MDMHEYWKAVLKQDAAAMRKYFAPEACVRWHNTKEQFSVEEFIRANCEYPDDWEGEIERIEKTGELTITVTHVQAVNNPSLSFHVTSFLKIRNDKIISLDEYWGDDGPAPQWRQAMHIGTEIK